MLKTNLLYADTPAELEQKLENFLNGIGWDRVVHIDYSQGDK